MLTLDTPLTALATDEEMSAIATSIYDNLDSIGDDLIDSSVVGEDWGDALDRVLRADESATISDLRVELLTSR